MTTADEKLFRFKELLELTMSDSKRRGRMYARSVNELAASWDMLDNVFFILNDIELSCVELRWNYFLDSGKGYGLYPIDYIIKNIDSKEDPYVVLTKLREEYEAWRDEKIEKMKAENVKDM